MKAAIFDTTVWVDFLRGKNTDEARLLNDFFIKNHAIVLCPTIVQEILQGIRDDSDYVRIKTDIEALTHLNLDPYVAASGAVDLYRFLRKKGVTIRKSADCLIAYYAMHFNISLVHNDSDFDLIAKHSKLKIMKP